MADGEMSDLVLRPLAPGDEAELRRIHETPARSYEARRRHNPPMAGKGEELVRRAWHALNANESADGVLADLDGVFDPEIEYVNPPDAVERGTRRGPEGMRAALENWYGGAGPEGRFEIQELIEREDMVFVRGRTHAHGAASGIEVAGTGVGILYTIRDDRIWRVEWHWNQEEARERFEQRQAS